MIEAPFGFFEMVVKVVPADATELGQAKFGKAPERLNPIDVAAASGELIFMMMDAIVLVALQDEAVVSLPSIRVNGAATADHMAPDHAHQFSFRAVHDGRTEDSAPPFEQANYGDFTPGSTPTLAPHTTRSKVAFIHFHTAGERSRLCFRQHHHSCPQQAVDPMRGVLV